MPSDEDGFFGRQCPSCGQMFRISTEDYDALPNDQRLWCVYCGHHDNHGEFTTDAQADRATRLGTDVAHQIVQQAVDDMLRGFNQRGPVTVTYRPKPSIPSRCRALTKSVFSALASAVAATPATRCLGSIGSVQSAVHWRRG